MTSHKGKHYSRQPDYGFKTKDILNTTVKVVEIGAVTSIGIAVIGALKPK
jgi:hypothetical protein